MKSKIFFTLLLFVITILFSPGCYTILLIENDTENASIESSTISDEYIPGYIPEPNPISQIGPPPYVNPATIVVETTVTTDNNSPSNNRREIQTGRNTPDSQTDNANETRRNSGAQRGGR